MTEQTTRSRAEKPLVLIIDDLPQNLQILGNLLKKIDCRVAISTSGKQALEMTEKMDIDLVLLDILMPEMDGFEVCTRMKQNPRTSDIPVIFLTAARKESNDIVEGFRKGAVDYITKPINEEELIARVNTHLELKRSRQTILKKNQEQNELLHILCHDLVNPFSNLESLFELCEEDMSLFGDVFDNLKISVKNGLAIIDLVREMSILEEENGSLTLTAQNLLEAVTESQSMLKHRFESKKVELDIQIKNETWVMAERTSLVNSVLNNLMTNALKFSYPGNRVIISADQNSETTRLIVKDNGIGMTPSLVEELFEISKPVSRPGTQGEQGTGFGMRLVKKYVSAYGGTIEIRSSDNISHPQNHGTEVIINFPLITPGEQKMFERGPNQKCSPAFR